MILDPVLGLGALLMLAIVGWGAWHLLSRAQSPASVTTRSTEQASGQKGTRPSNATSLIIGGIALGIPLLLWLAIGAFLGVRSMPPPEPALPELEAYPLNHRQIAEGDTKAAIIRKLGEPVLVVVDTESWLPEFLAEEWLYPIRLSGGSYNWQVRAPLLKIRVDRSGSVTEWGFFHPVTGERFAVSETEASANRWLNWHCGRDWGPRVNLDHALRVGMTKQDVLTLMGAEGLQPWAARQGEKVFVRPDPETGGEVLTYPVDHPSPLYIPAFYVAIDFSPEGTVTSWSIEGYCSRMNALGGQKVSSARPTAGAIRISFWPPMGKASSTHAHPLWVFSADRCWAGRRSLRTAPPPQI